MKSAYLIAMISCFTMTWLYEEKKKRGIRVNAALETALGYFVTRILLLVISEQSLRGCLTVLAMDLVTGGLWFLMTEKEIGQRRSMEYLFFYIWNPAPVMAVISQNKDRMVGIWLAVMGLSLLVRNLRKMGQEKKSCFFVINYLGSAAAGAGWIWARDIQGESVRMMIPGGGKLPVLLTLSLAVGAGVFIYNLVVLISERRRKKSGSECCPDMDENGDTGFLEKQENKTASGRHKAFWTGKDWCLLFAMTAFFCVLALSGIGSTKAPQTVYRFEKGSANGNEMILKFDGSVTISKAVIYLGVKEKRTFAFSVPNASGDGWDSIMEPQELKSVFCWNEVGIHYRTYELGIVSMDDYAEILEIVLLDPDGKLVLPVNAARYPEAFDEQELYPEYTTYEYRTMFDEVYHARTAYEMLHRLPIYENTHPPLGKYLMSLGIRIFGMTPFGWRIVCALMGTLMVPVCYAFMRSISGNAWIAAFTSALMIFDFMHFTLSRIGTIDVIVAFFILLTFYLMYLVLEELKKGLSFRVCVLMALNGVSAGAAMASKWTGVYACAGIAVMFFSFLYREYGTTAVRVQKKLSGRNSFYELGQLFLICVTAYLIIPAVIYTASYLSWNEDGNLLRTMWDNQVRMLTYHENTVFDHPYSSEWYDWIWMRRPLLDAYTGLGTGKISVVSTFGNPVIWWGGIPALFYNLYLWQVKRDGSSGYLCISYLAMLVPWFFIHRTVFIYQYFACSTILILMLGNCCRFLKRSKKKMLLFLVAAAAVFFLFYPVISGYPVKKAFSGRWLEWLGSWVLS